jgi:hypothetical protein
MTLKVWKINVVQYSLSQFKWQIRGALLENIFVKLFVSFKVFQKIEIYQHSRS